MHILKHICIIKWRLLAMGNDIIEWNDNGIIERSLNKYKLCKYINDESLFLGNPPKFECVNKWMVGYIYCALHMMRIISHHVLFYLYKIYICIYKRVHELAHAIRPLPTASFNTNYALISSFLCRSVEGRRVSSPHSLYFYLSNK